MVDLRTLRFVDAYGLVGLACALRLARDRSEPVVVKVPTARTMQSHLTAMGFRDFLATVGEQNLLPASPTIEASDVVVPLQSPRDSGGAQALSNVIWEQLRDHVDPQVLGALTEGVWEMVANALEHSGSDALILGQVYSVARGGKPPDHDDRVQVVIADTGRGIRESFLATGARQPASDLEAIILSLEYLVTSVIGDPGRGQGLSTTEEQVRDVRGRMIVRSGRGKVEIEGAARREVAVPYLPGVIVALSLPLYPS